MRTDKNGEEIRKNISYILQFIDSARFMESSFDKKLKERFFNTCKFSNHNNNHFILLLRKTVYPYEYMDYWEKFNEASLPGKENFYSHLSMADITNADNTHTKGVCKDFKIKNLGEHYGF